MNGRAHTLIALTALLLLAAAVPGSADAKLIVTPIDTRLVPQDNDYTRLFLDLDDDGTDDFIVELDPLNTSEFGWITRPSTGPLVSVSLATETAVSFAAGDLIDLGWFDGSSGRGRAGGLLYNATGGHWALPGWHGFAGLSLRDGGVQRFGWLELTRGTEADHRSLLVGRMGFEDEGAAAWIPTPAPSPLALLLIAGILPLLRVARRGIGRLTPGHRRC